MSEPVQTKYIFVAKLKTEGVVVNVRSEMKLGWSGSLYSRRLSLDMFLFSETTAASMEMEMAIVRFMLCRSVGVVHGLRIVMDFGTVSLLSDLGQTG